MTELSNHRWVADMLADTILPNTEAVDSGSIESCAYDVPDPAVGVVFDGVTQSEPRTVITFADDTGRWFVVSVTAVDARPAPAAR